ncbi:MAG: alcohol dehydrogenase catalytic domain-containing protein [Acutalibacteraceae bacterium]|nr:alcohol dehydrogenase catalytic domain-containing protein [Acutalibacteraceae bacterium]
MFAKSYKITEPKRFEIFVEDIRNENVLVRPDYLAVCKADIRYYLGNRSLSILKRKFPMSLIHEATGVVVRDKSGEFKSGQRVVLLPCRRSECDGSKCEVCVRDNPHLLDNYCPESKFCSSNYDGFSKELIDLDKEYMIPIPDEIGEEAVFSELISVGCCALRRAGFTEGESVNSVTVWGDGIMGYIISLVAKYGFGCEVNIVGLSKEKLEKFDFANVYYSNDIEALPRMSVAIEAVGGNASGIAANQAIDKLYSGGKLILSGVANDNVPLNTRMVLEHGISIRGTTRSVRCDFEKAVELLTIPEFRKHIKTLLLSVREVNNIRDYYAVFEEESKSTALGKNIMKISF